MQTKYLFHKQICTPTNGSEELNSRALMRLDQLERVAQAVQSGCAKVAAIKCAGISQSSYYRYNKNIVAQGIFGLEDKSRRPKTSRKAEKLEDATAIVLETRGKFPLWGKAKIAAFLKQNYQITISESTVGRIISRAIAKKQIESIHFLYGQRRVKPRKFNQHAQRWRPELRALLPGQMLQIDHSKLADFAPKTLVHFGAVCPVSKWATAEVFEHATSQNAAQFLTTVLRQAPFQIESIQVDGGSEFMGYFEEFCGEKDIKLYVLPPKSPELNGNVERSNFTFKYEFYRWYRGNPETYPIQIALDKFCKFYNFVRPHQGLKHLTPALYLKQLNFMVDFSQMS